MTELSDRLTAPFDEASPFTDRSLAQLALAMEAAGIADTAGALVHVRSEPDSDYAAICAAVRLVERAERLLERAVVAACLGEMPVRDISFALGMSPEQAFERYRRALGAFRNALIEPDCDDGMTGRAVGQPEAEATVLDAWVQRHRDGVGTDMALVSGGMRRLLPHAELALLAVKRSTRWNQVLDKLQAGSPVAPETIEEVAQLCERTAAVEQHVADVTDDPIYGARAQHARDSAADHRAQAIAVRRRRALADSHPLRHGSGSPQPGGQA